MIPAVEKRFRAAGKPAGRIVTGHSSGGWSSLWLQVAYPDFFAGVWSTAPDPVDFRDFQRINIYSPEENVFLDRDGKARPLGRQKGKVILWYKSFSDMEEVLGRGGQLASFEAVFSDRGPDGRPKRLWDRKTGAIDPDVAKSWEKYDIRLVLERNWQTLGPKLRGKLRVYMGEEDTFYLRGGDAIVAAVAEEARQRRRGGTVPGQGPLLADEQGNADAHRQGDGGCVPGRQGCGVSSSLHIPTLSIVGVGLIGGSIALAVRQRGLADRIIGCDRSEQVLDRAAPWACSTNGRLIPAWPCAMRRWSSSARRSIAWWTA